MAITFERGTKVILLQGGARYEYLVSSATASQTFVESNTVRRTIQNSTLLDRSLIHSKSNCEFSFSIYLGRSEPEKALLNWFDMPFDGTKHQIATNYLIPTTAEVYIDAGNSIYKIPNAVGRNISFTISRKEILAANISAVGSDLVEVPSVPTTGPLYSQDPTTFYNAPISISGYSNLVGFTCELTREVRFLDKRGIFDIGSIYKSDIARVSNLALSGKITRNKLDDTNTYNESSVIDLTCGNFKLYLPQCNTTDRWEMGGIHTLITDYKVIGGGSYIII